MERVVRKAVAEKVGFGGAGTYWWGKFGEREKTERLRPDGQEDAQSLWHRILLSVLVVSALPQASSPLTRTTALAPNSYPTTGSHLGPPLSAAESVPSHACLKMLNPPAAPHEAPLYVTQALPLPLALSPATPNPPHPHPAHKASHRQNRAF